MFQFPSTVQILESFWFECVRGWSAHLPEIIFSLSGQGISCSMETYTLGRRLVCTCCSQQAFTALEVMPGAVVALAQKLIRYLEFLILQAGRGGGSPGVGSSQWVLDPRGFLGLFLVLLRLSL